MSIDVIFDPSIVGPARSKLTVTHPMAGTYSCIIQAVALQPKPQGPLIVRNGATLKIPFKNVSKDPNPYSFAVDNNAFSVKPATETVAGKATTSVRSCSYNVITHRLLFHSKLKVLPLLPAS